VTSQIIRLKRLLECVPERTANVKEAKTLLENALHYLEKRDRVVSVSSSSLLTLQCDLGNIHAARFLT